MRAKSVSLKNNNSIFVIIKGALHALIVSLVCILIFAFVIKLTSISDGLIKPVNQIIKVVSILFGCLGAFKARTDKTLVKGMFIGVLYTILAFILFSSLNGKFDFSISLFLDALFAGAVGVISGIISNIFKKR